VETTATGDLVVNVTPTELSDVVATMTKPGFDIFQQTIVMVEAFGTLTGAVLDGDNGGAAMPGARVVGFVAGDDPAGTPLFDLTTNALGQYTAPEELAVGNYDLYVTKFGYLPYQEVYFLLFGANDHDITVGQAPNGVLSGVVTESETGQAVYGATVRVYRTDNDELFDETSTDTEGAYATMALPFFDYRVDVRASGRIPTSDVITVDAASVVQDFAMDATNGNILVLNDNSSEPRRAEAKYDDLGHLLAPAYDIPAGRAAADVVADLEELGYSVVMEAAGTTNPDDWAMYDLILTSSGANTSPLGSASLRAALAAFKADGGRLMVEGGEIAYDLNYGDSAFLENTLHVTGWSGDSSGDMSVADAGHSVMSLPNLITGPITNDYSGYGDADRAPVAANAVMAGAWTSYGSMASVVCYDDDTVATDGQFVFFLFNYSAMGEGRMDLLQNAVMWLLGTGGLDPTPVETEELPRTVMLTGNYPNPFNPMTIIEFALPSAQDVQLSIFDVRGQKVRTLVNDVVAAGSHQVTWQGKDDSGRQMASGTYFYRLSTDSGAQVKKMLLVK